MYTGVFCVDRVLKVFRADFVPWEGLGSVRDFDTRDFANLVSKGFQFVVSTY